MTGSEERDFVTIERGDGIARVVFDRRGARNALSHRAMAELTAAAEVLADDDGVRAVVLSGAGDCFSAGFDLKDEDWRAATDPLTRRRHAGQGARLCAAWARLPQLSVAAIEGFAVGGGLSLAVALDWRVMARDAFVTFPEVKVGLNLGWGTVPRLVSLIGPARAKRAIVLCERLDAATASAWGLVDEIAEPGAALDRALALAAQAAAMPALPARMTKESVDALATALHPLAAHMDVDQGSLCFEGPDFAAARDAFARKRT